MRKTNLKGTAVLLFIFLFMYAANYLMPLSYGDDCIYSFVWEEGQRFYDPLPETARRIASWEDYFDSLWNHYFSHSGRVVNFLPVFFFLWQGKEYFNFFNAFLFVLLIAEIYWLSNKGKITFHFQYSKICWIFFLLWSLQLVFIAIFLWLTGSCNYLWPAVLWSGFLIPYMRKWHEKESKKEEDSLSFGTGMFFFGMLAGWTNENTGCFFIPLLAILMFLERKNGRKIRQWEILGLAGFVIGYAFLILAPGNFARIAEDLEHGTYSSDWRKNIYQNGAIFSAVLLIQSPLWIYLTRIMQIARKHPDQEEIRQDVMSINGLAVTGLCTNLVMLLSPEFPLRSAFPGLLLLLTAVMSASRLTKDMGWQPWNRKLKSVCRTISVVYFIFTACLSFYGWEKLYTYHQEVLRLVERQKNSSAEEILEVEDFDIPSWLCPASGYHVIKFTFDESSEDWRNAAYARYYGIPGIRKINKEN